MSSTYVNGVQTVVVKNKYAYHYNKAGSCIGKSQFEPTRKGRRDFIKKLFAAGFTRDEADYQDSLRRLR